MADGPQQRQLAAGCRELGLELPEPALRQLGVLVELLEKWNRVYNLTAVRSPGLMVTRHILDSLALVPFLGSGRLLDVGCGAGFPGLPVAIASPDLEVVMLDSSAKKLRFVRQAVAECGLGNAQVVHARMQEYRPARSFDMVTSRAVGSLGELYRNSVHLLAEGGEMLFMKGQCPSDELDTLPRGAGKPRIERLRVPGLDAERHLVRVKKREWSSQ